MNALEICVSQVRGLALSLQDILILAECARIEPLIDHGEWPEALVCLDWIERINGSSNNCCAA
jgi:hypothetical protein